MNNLSNDQEAELKRLAVLFVEIYTGHNPEQLDETIADDITDDFHVLIMDEFVNPFIQTADDGQ